MNEWHKVGIEVPPQWQAVVRARSEELGSPMRYMWVAAIDLLLSQPAEEIERRCLAVELMARKDFDQLDKAGPGATGAVLANVAANFSAAAAPKKKSVARSKKTVKKK